MKPMVLGVAGGVVLALVALNALTSRDPLDQEADALQPDSDEYLSAVRPHLAIPGWTDLQLLTTGQDLCEELDRNDGDVRALIPFVQERATANGYVTPADIAAAQNDYTLIIDGSIKWLCPQWAEAYIEQFPTAPPG